MEDRTFVEWLQYLHKPTPTKLFLKRLRERHDCVGGCGKTVHGWEVGHECQDCFRKRINEYKAYIYI